MAKVSDYLSFSYGYSTVLEARAHEPPPPYDERYYRCGYQAETPSRIEQCLKHPPAEGGVTSPTPISLKIKGKLQTGFCKAAQVFVVKVKAISADKLLVAKLYDPYFSLRCEVHEDRFKFADYYYSCETAAYCKLQHLQGVSILRYYGSYTCALPAGEGRHRHVRPVLLEYITGVPLDQMDEDRLSEAERRQVMRQAVEVEHRVYN